jgi:hypothetical protein
VIPVTRPKQLLLEAAVCDEHHALIEAGAAWEWNIDHGEILMGSDVTPRVKQFKVIRTPARTELGDSLTIEIELERDGEIVDLVRVRVSSQLAQKLAEAITRRRPPE